MSSLYEYNPETGAIEYTEGEVTDDDINVNENVVQGDLLEYPEEIPEEQVDPDLDPASGNSVMLLSEDAVTALAATSPAAGSLNSSVIDYFDRLVAGLPSDYVYVAYRNDPDDAYAGTIVYGEDYDISNGTIIFGSEAVEIDVSRTSGSGYSTYISYLSSDASNSVFSPSQNGTILYYTNAFPGYPVLGGLEQAPGISLYLVVGLISAFATAVLTKLLCKR